MNILLSFYTKNFNKNDLNINFTGNEPVKKYIFKEFKQWQGTAYISENNSVQTTIDCDDENIFLASGVYATKNELSKNFESEKDLINLSGHYLIIQQKKNSSVSIITDPMLSIPVYIFKDKNFICMSTRLDWLIVHVKRDWKISWEQIFSFVFNSSYAGRGVFINDIKLANYGSIYSFSDAGKFVSKQYWQPPFLNEESIVNKNYKLLADILVDVVENIMLKHERIVIPLTAGIDSRLILLPL